MLATLKGRLQTKVVTFIILAGITGLFVAGSGSSIYVELLVISVLVGLWLETLWGVLITYQPGWLTFVLGAVEFIWIAVIAAWRGVDISLGAAAAYYLAAWITIQLFLLYILPILRLSWADDGGELW